MMRKLPGILVAVIAVAMIGSGFYLEQNEIDLLNPKPKTEEKKPEKENKEEEKKEEQKEETPKKEDTTSSSIPGLDIKNLEPTDEIVTKLYNMIQLKEENFNTFYEQDKILASELPRSVKLKLTIQNMEIAPGSSSQLSEEAVIANHKKLFGPNDAYQFESPLEDSCMKITKEQENLQIQNQCPSNYVDTTQRQVYKAMQSGNDIYIYEVVAFHKFTDETRNTSNIYSDFQRTNLVAENIPVNKDPKNYQEITEKLNDLPQYKYTFKLGDNQNYYFYGVEKILYL